MLSWVSQQRTEIQVITVEIFCDNWLKFALITVQSCAVYMEMNRESFIVLLHNANFQAIPIAACTSLAPNIFPLKPNLSLTDRNGELSNISDQSLTSFSVFEI